jgi:hypothetical protein
MDKKLWLIFIITIFECLVVAAICTFLPKWIAFILTIINGPAFIPVLDYIYDNLLGG